jgi:hypothetical protein
LNAVQVPCSGNERHGRGALRNGRCHKDIQDTWLGSHVKILNSSGGIIKQSPDQGGLIRVSFEISLTSCFTLGTGNVGSILIRCHGMVKKERVLFPRPCIVGGTQEN